MQNSEVAESYHTLNDEREIGKYKGETGPTVIVLGGLHGNEPAGITAFKRVLRKLQNNKIDFRGTIYGIKGNLSAITSTERYVDEDMNRNWHIFLEKAKEGELNSDIRENLERKELIDCIVKLCSNAEEPIIFFDLHSTSAPSIPFIAINDSLYNRQIVKGIPVPIILGLQEQIDGTLNGELNELGLPCILFEAGQHDIPETIDYHEAFIWYMLYKMNCIPRNSQKSLRKYRDKLLKASNNFKGFFEVTYRHNILDKDQFIMRPGYSSFQDIQKDEILGQDVNGSVKSLYSDKIFMPLYQSKGADGFFLIRRIRPFWIRFSKWLRRNKVDKLIILFPGVTKNRNLKDTYTINRKIAFLFALPLFHLLGYRKRKQVGDELIVSRIQYDDHPPKISEFLNNLKEKLNQ